MIVILMITSLMAFSNAFSTYETCFADINHEFNVYEANRERNFSSINYIIEYNIENELKEWSMPSWDDITGWISDMLPDIQSALPDIPIPTVEEWNSFIDGFHTMLSDMNGVITSLMEALEQLKMPAKEDNKHQKEEDIVKRQELQKLVIEVFKIYQPFVSVTKKFEHIVKSYVNESKNV